ncbi:MAG TPA: SMC-Scp complex subunit ScpB [Deltaproteobacteria bacterium]|nr:SMC-Scp complex subunit ScpB [Deltaproteobacteria bacterium]
MTNREIVEALVFSCSGVCHVDDIERILPGLGADEIEKIVDDLNRVYESTGRSFRIQRAASGYLFATKPEYAPFVRQLVSPVRLSNAALEVLAVIAYKGPCTRQTIDRIRGVDSSSSLKQLIRHQLVDVRGTKPMTYSTSKKFLEVFGLASLSDLPDITQFEEVFGDEACGGRDASGGQ